MELKVMNKLIELGIPTHIYGFKLLQFILTSALKDGELEKLNIYYEVLAEAEGRSKNSIVLNIVYARERTKYKNVTNREFISRLFLEMKYGV